MAALTALYILCMTQNIDTVSYYQEIKERLDYLIDDLFGRMLEKFPPRSQMEV